MSFQRRAALSDSNKLPSEIPFASLFVYSPRAVEGEGEAGAKSRRLVRSIKNETQQFSTRWKLAEFVRDNLGDNLGAKYFGSNVTLAPMPGHAPLKDKDSRWPARSLCAEFVLAGLGKQWIPLIERVRLVNKAAFSPPDERPTALEHFESFQCVPQIGVGECITVVDDVITRGSTMLAAVAALRAAYPGTRVQGFTLIRTMSGVAIERVVEPVEGTIRISGKDTFRKP